MLFSGNSFSSAANTRAQFSLTKETTARLPHNMSAAIPLPARQNMCAKSCKELQQRRLLETGRELPHRKWNQTKPNLSFCLYLLVKLCPMRPVRPTAGNLYIISLHYQVGRLVSIWVLPASRWAVPFIHIILVLFASGKWLLSLFPFLYRNCDHWAPFSFAHVSPA